MLIIKCHHRKDEFSAAEKCAASLTPDSGKVLLLPTETVYGLICRWDDQSARKKIYEMKKRSDNKPLQMLAPDLNTVLKSGLAADSRINALVSAFCPGPITIVAPASDGSKIGFRMPDHTLIKSLLSMLDCPLAATSANLSGKPPALSFETATAELAIQPDIGVDSGEVPLYSKASTVVEVLSEGWKILRDGPITHEQIDKVIRACK